MITFEPLFTTLKRKHIPINRLIKSHVVGGGTLQRIRNNESISTDTLNDICDFLKCGVQSVMKYTPTPQAQEEQRPD